MSPLAVGVAIGQNPSVRSLSIWPCLVVALLLATSGAANAQTTFRFPAVDPSGRLFMEAPIIGVDDDDLHDSADRVTCINYAGQPFPYCYNDHAGTDFLLADGFAGMDQGVSVVAGADGEVLETVDGNYDRCHSTTDFVVSCDGHPVLANRVVLRHSDGLQSSYWHLRSGSILVRVGDKVRCGQPLALVGSSGNSAMPHLHFQLEAASGEIIDPFAGPRSQALSYWLQQVGPFGRPGALCPGESAPPEARVATRDAGPHLDVGPAADGGRGASAAASGCALARIPPATATPLGLLPLLALGWLVARARRFTRREAL